MDFLKYAFRISDSPHVGSIPRIPGENNENHTGMNSNNMVSESRVCCLLGSSWKLTERLVKIVHGFMIYNKQLSPAHRIT